MFSRELGSPFSQEVRAGFPPLPALWNVCACLLFFFIAHIFEIENYDIQKYVFLQVFPQCYKK
jgi:hypothetical protein